MDGWGREISCTYAFAVDPSMTKWTYLADPHLVGLTWKVNL